MHAISKFTARMTCRVGAHCHSLELIWFIKAQRNPPSSSFDKHWEKKIQSTVNISNKRTWYYSCKFSRSHFLRLKKPRFNYNWDNLAIFGNGDGEKTVQANFRIWFSDCWKPRHMMKIFNSAASWSTSPAQHKSHYQTAPVRTYKIPWNMAVQYRKLDLYKLPSPNRS